MAMAMAMGKKRFMAQEKALARRKEFMVKGKVRQEEWSTSFMGPSEIV